MNLKQDILKGKGNVILTIKNNPGLYEEQILWAIDNNISWDLQSDGTKSEYIYDMIINNGKQEQFLNHIISSINIYNKDIWQFCKLIYLLSNFYQDGNEQALVILKQSYDNLLLYLMKLNERPSDYFYERDNFEDLAILLAVSKEKYLEIKEDINKLLELEIYTEDDFNIFLSLYNNSKFKRIKFKEDNNIYTFEQYFKGEIKSYTFINYLENKNIKDVSYGVKYFSHENSKEKELAIELYQCIKCEAALNWAIDHINQENKNDLLPIIIINYKTKNKQLILDYLKSYDLNYEHFDDLHGIISLTLTYKRLPSEFYQFIYNNSYCGFCKYNAFLYLVKRNAISKETLEEALYDANIDIRKTAKRKLKKRCENV